MSTTADFAPTPEAAQERLRRIDPITYGHTRNALDGAVTGLSPYFTHGLLDATDALAALQARHALGPQDKLVMQLGWREFFAHVWRHQGERIFSDLRPAITTLPYRNAIPEDVLSASSGVAVIDQAVRQLHATGYLHNHARLWLASYLVHLRKVHWRVGADWLYAHLLDGDLASNHLSWQWVAGTFSIKPYLFNAENVARFAPPAWHSPGTVIDRSYEQLNVIARESADCGAEPLRPPPLEAPECFDIPPQTFEALPDPLPSRIRLVHPWSLGEAPDTCWRLGVIHLPFHRRFPWSAARWQFVTTRLRGSCDAVFVGDLGDLMPRLNAHRTVARDTANPGYAEHLRNGQVQLEAIPRFLQDPDQYCQSFSKFYGVQGKWH